MDGVRLSVFGTILYAPTLVETGFPSYDKILPGGAGAILGIYWSPESPLEVGNGGACRLKRPILKHIKQNIKSIVIMRDVQLNHTVKSW